MSATLESDPEGGLNRIQRVTFGGIKAKADCPFRTYTFTPSATHAIIMIDYRMIVIIHCYTIEVVEFGTCPTSGTYIFVNFRNIA